MPVVNVPESCAGCGACCVGLNVSAVGGKVPEIMVEERDGVFCMKRRVDGMCVALDPATRLCVIYDRRPEVCRGFPANSEQCLDALHKFQRNTSDRRAHEVEQAFKAVIDCALTLGYAPEVRFTNLGAREYVVYLRHTTLEPDVRVEVSKAARAGLAEAVGRVRGSGE